MGELGMMTKEYKVSFWGGENALKLTVMRVAHLYDCAENHQLLPFKWVDGMVCELQLKKGVETINNNNKSK